MRLSLFITHWHLDSSLELVAAVSVGLYARAVTRVRGRWPCQRTLSFIAGVGCVIVALQSGIDTFDDRLLSVHMVQHLLLLIVAPLLLLLGQPMLLALRVLPGRARRPLARSMTRASKQLRPVRCLASFTVVVLLTHVPAFYDATLEHPLLHQTEHILYLGAGLLLWWPMLDIDPVPSRRLGGIGRLLYLLASMAPMAVLGAFLDRYPSLVYTPYGPAARALGVAAVVDQQHAGAIMWVAGSMIMTVAGLWAVLAALLADERRQRRGGAATATATSTATHPGATIG